MPTTDSRAFGATPEMLCVAPRVSGLCTRSVASPQVQRIPSLSNGLAAACGFVDAGTIGVWTEKLSVLIGVVIVAVQTSAGPSFFVLRYGANVFGWTQRRGTLIALQTSVPGGSPLALHAESVR